MLQGTTFINDSIKTLYQYIFQIFLFQGIQVNNAAIPSFTSIKNYMIS